MLGKCSLIALWLALMAASNANVAAPIPPPGNDREAIDWLRANAATFADTSVACYGFIPGKNERSGASSVGFGFMPIPHDRPWI